MRPGASHPRSPMRHCCTSKGVMRCFLRSAQSNGVEHRCAAQRCALVRTGRNFLGHEAQGSPYKVTPSPNYPNSCDAMTCGMFHRNSNADPWNLTRAATCTARIASHRRMVVFNREAARKTAAPRLRDRMPETPSTLKNKSFNSVHFMCELPSSCVNPVRFDEFLLESLGTVFHLVNEFVTTACLRFQICSESWRFR